MIAILGATGYIGRSLAKKWAACNSEPLALFARMPQCLIHEDWPAHVVHKNLSNFDAAGFSLVINALGAGDPNSIVSLGSDIFDVTRTWDERVLSSMAPETAYVFLSSGAVYGPGLAQAVDSDSVLSLPVNHFDRSTPYTLAKLCAEARHRCLPARHILDLRVFGYADASISQSGSFFLSELSHAVAARKRFVTSPAEMIRDYAGVDELYDLIQAWKRVGGPNRALDLYTQAPVGKLALLEVVSKRYGLEIVREGGSAGGARPVYASQFHAAAELGYRPARTSLQVVLETLDAVAAS